MLPGFYARLTGAWFTFQQMVSSDPDPKSCSIQQQNSGIIMTPLNGGCADEKVTIHRGTDLEMCSGLCGFFCFCLTGGRDILAAEINFSTVLEGYFLRSRSKRIPV